MLPSCGKCTKSFSPSELVIAGLTGRLKCRFCAVQRTSSNSAILVAVSISFLVAWIGYSAGVFSLGIALGLGTLLACAMGVLSFLLADREANSDSREVNRPND